MSGTCKRKKAARYVWKDIHKTKTKVITYYIEKKWLQFACAQTTGYNYFYYNDT